MLKPSNKKPEDAYKHASGGWGSLKAVGVSLLREHSALEGSKILLKQNKTDGFMCVGCSWAKPASPHTFEFCESGAKATAWDITTKRVDPDFFTTHTVAELSAWHDRDLEEAGRVTAPLRWDAESDCYREVSWESAFAEIGAELRAVQPDQTVFYASGRASLETSYMYQLFARMYGTNNLPDSSNMCHESTSVALTAAIGVGVGTITLDDFEKADLMFFFGQNPGTNSPRMLHPLQEARKRGVPIITFNPLREPGLVSFVNPQSPTEMLMPGSTSISTTYLQVKAGGDSAAIAGICKALFEMDDEDLKNGGEGVLDRPFIAQHTLGFEDFRTTIHQYQWSDLIAGSGLSQEALTDVAHQYARANAVMAHFGMGITQHREGVQNVRMIMNLLLLRGNIGKPGAGPSPVRGHSNVQGQRTVGITEKPELAPLDELAKQFEFEPPRHKGLNTVEACEKVLSGDVRAVIQLGGNLVRSVPDRDAIEPAWKRLRLTVGITTKLNRSHLVHGAVSYILPCLSRIEIDERGGVEQSVSMEDSTGCMHGSRGVKAPADPRLLSEPAIVAGLAKATLGASRTETSTHAGKVDWEGWSNNYALVRDAIAETYPTIFHDFNKRLGTPGGFHRPLPVIHREWPTKSKKAEFLTTLCLDEDADMPTTDPQALRLFTLRSDSQFNTSIYDLDDRFRGISNSREVVLMHPSDATAHGLAADQKITLETISSDAQIRRVANLRVVFYDIPRGCIAGYFPECNPLVPLWHHAKESKVPAAKSIPVRVVGGNASPS